LSVAHHALLAADMRAPPGFVSAPAPAVPGAGARPRVCRRASRRVRMTAAPAQTTISPQAPGASSGVAISALRDVSYSVGGVSVVEGVNLDLLDGEIVALLGPSGSGKRYVCVGLQTSSPLFASSD
jgi:ABC-type glutathione transport system ATPase component